MNTASIRLPDPLAEAARNAAQVLDEALLPHMLIDAPPPQISALWQVMKLLRAVAGDLDFGDVPAEDVPREQWDEAAGLAAAVTGHALTAVAAGLDLEQAQARLDTADEREQSVAMTSRVYAAVVDLTPPDHEDTGRTLTATVSGPSRTVQVTADRGPAPIPRPHTAATLLRTAFLMHRLGEVLDEVVLEPWEDGVPRCGRPDRDVVCEICQQPVSADTARTAWHRQKPQPVTVCSPSCARAASAGEHLT